MSGNLVSNTREILKCNVQQSFPGMTWLSGKWAMMQETTLKRNRQSASEAIRQTDRYTDAQAEVRDQLIVPVSSWFCDSLAELVIKHYMHIGWKEKQTAKKNTFSHINGISFLIIIITLLYCTQASAMRFMQTESYPCIPAHVCMCVCDGSLLLHDVSFGKRLSNDLHYTAAGLMFGNEGSRNNFMLTYVYTRFLKKLHTALEVSWGEVIDPGLHFPDTLQLPHLWVNKRHSWGTPRIHCSAAS